MSIVVFFRAACIARLSPEPCLRKAIFPLAPCSVFVNDVTQLSTVSSDQVQHGLGSGAQRFHRLAHRLKLWTSPKSKVVTSCLGFTGRVISELQSRSLRATRAKTVRDLGLLFTAGKTRGLGILAERGVKSRLRVKKISSLAKSARPARRLFTIGALPQGTWGHSAFGLVPYGILNLHRQAGACTGIVKLGDGSLLPFSSRMASGLTIGRRSSGTPFKLGSRSLATLIVWFPLVTLGRPGLRRRRLSFLGMAPSGGARSMA